MHSCRRSRNQTKRSYVVSCCDNIRLDKLVGSVRWKCPGGSHRSFIERPLRTDTVIATVAQENRPLLAHRVIGWIHTVSIEHDRQSALLRVATHRCPMVV